MFAKRPGPNYAKRRVVANDIFRLFASRFTLHASRFKMTAAIEDPKVNKKILEYIGLPK
jgi:hypothetical protein